VDNAAKRRTGFARRALGLLLLTGVAAYVAVCLGMGICQRRLLYHPRHVPAEQVEALAKQARLERWRDASGEAIGFKRLSSSQPASGQVLILYGNGGSATGCAHYADDIQGEAALDVFILDYPGYADRTGSPTERNLYRAADQALQTLATNLPTYLLGESLGTGVAAYLAGSQPDRIAGVVLLSPFDGVANVAQDRFPFLPTRFLLIDRFSSADHLRGYCGPVAVMVDGRDNVVPERFGRRLYDGYAGPKKLWEFPKHGHIRIGEPRARFWREVLSFWQLPGHEMSRLGAGGN